jgi:hypothetical protein
MSISSKIQNSWVWWHMPVTPALRMQEDEEFKSSLGYIVRLCLKKQKKVHKLFHKGLKRSGKNSSTNSGINVMLTIFEVV